MLIPKIITFLILVAAGWFSIAKNPIVYAKEDFSQLLLEKEEYYNWENNNWKLTRDNSYSYNDSSILVQSRESYHNTDYFYEYLYSYTFDKNGNLIEKITKYKKDSLNEVNLIKDVYNYNEKNQKTLFLQYKWDTLNQKWLLYCMNEYSYNNNGLLKEEIDFIAYYLGSLDYLYKKNYYYDSKNRISLIRIYDYEERTFSSKYVYYDDINRTDTIYYRWFEIPEYPFSGYYYQRDIEKYTNDGKLLEFTIQANGKDSNFNDIWINENFYEYQYDLSGWLKNTKYYWWRKNYWQLYYSTDHYYNENDSLVLSVSKKPKNDSSFVNYQKIVRKFRSPTFVSDYKNPDNIAFSIFPNPASNEIEIVFNRSDYILPEVLIFDLNGKLYSSRIYYNITENPNKIKIDISGLKNGKYLCRIKSLLGVKSRIFVISK